MSILLINSDNQDRLTFKSFQNLFVTTSLKDHNNKQTEITINTKDSKFLELGKKTTKPTNL